MIRVLRWTAAVIGGFVVLVVVTLGVLSFMGAARLGRTYDVDVAGLEIPDDSAVIARGRHLAQAVTLCTSCHGEDLGGGSLMEEPMIATIYASNLTSGRGGVGTRYTEADYARAIRHGVNADGRGLMIMHSDHYNRLGREDLAALVAYVRSVPPVDREGPTTGGAFLGRAMLTLGFFDMEQMPLISAEVIDHSKPLAEAPTPGPTPEYGRYLVSIGVCTMCHGEDLTGGPPIEEGAPPAPNIAVYGAEGGWSEEQFLTTLRTGVTPYQRELDPEAMPWEVYGRMTDVELRAIRAYLATLDG